MRRQAIEATVPLMEMFGYATDLRSRTQGRATYSMEFDRYDQFRGKLPKRSLPNIVVSRPLVVVDLGGSGMAKAKFERRKPHVNIGTIGHVDRMARRR